MASYRDPRNPDTLLFPGNMLPRVLIVVALFVNLLCAAASILIPAPWYIRLFDALLLAAVTWFEIRSWPGSITSNPQGLRLFNMLGREIVFLPWNSIQSIEKGYEFGGPDVAALGLSTDILIISGPSPGQTIIHTPRHPDRDRLHREFQNYKVFHPKKP